MDYPDKISESRKADIAEKFETNFCLEKKHDVSQRLYELVSITAITGYVDRVRSALSSLPQEFRFILKHESSPICFESIDEASAFLKNPRFEMDNPAEEFVYEVTYTDGSEFRKEVSSVEAMQSLHGQILALEQHMKGIVASR